MKPYTTNMTPALGCVFCKNELFSLSMTKSNELDWLSGGGEMGKLIRSMDWSQNALGPIENWPQSLKTAVSLCLSSTFPINIAWGPEHVQIYNDAYRPICGALHPASMGSKFKECWASALPVVGAHFDRAFDGEGTYIPNQRMFLERYGYLEESFMTFSFSPIRDESGKVGGIFHPISESTDKMLSSRRTQVIRDLAILLNEAKSTEEIYQLALKGMKDFELDIPFIHFYEDKKFKVGVGLSSNLDFTPFLDRKIVEDLSGKYGDFTSGPYEAAPNRAMILPISPPGAENPIAHIVVGVSACRDLDQDYLSFYDMLNTTFTTAFANVLAFEEEQKRARALAEIDKAKTAFFSNVSHEFRTPLTLILGPLEDTLRETLEVKQRERLEVTHRNATRLLKLVNSLLDFSRIEAGRIEASYEPTDISNFTRELASLFRSATEKAGLDLIIRTDNLKGQYFVDKEMWEKIILNLISNAYKFTFSGAITVEVNEVMGGARIAVSDTGIGVSLEEVPRLFERFHRVQGAKSRTHEGTGIGLALVHELVNLHGGEIKASSEVGKGTSFEIFIPEGSGHLPIEKINISKKLESTSVKISAFLDEAQHWEHKNHTREEGAVHSERVVLLVDDNSDMRDYVGSILKEKWKVISAGDGQEALEILQLNKVDLVLTDVMMPVLDGFGLLKKIRNHDHLKSIPVIMLSARAGEESKIEGLDAGADDYLVKPFSAKELLSRVGSVLSINEVRSEALTKFKSMFDHASVNIALVTLKGEILDVNQAFVQSTGYDKEEVLGKPFALITHPDDVSSNLETFRKVSTGEIPSALFEKRYLKKNGGVMWVQTGISVYYDENNRPMHVIAISQNIEDRKRSEAEAISANQAKSEFLANMSHEIRTPLGAILGYLDLMKNRNLGREKLENYISVIDRNSEQLLKIVDDILDLSKVEAGKLTLERIDFNFLGMIADLYSSMEVRAREKKIDFKFEALSLLPPQVISDSVRLRQILMNVIGNAIKFTDQGFVKVMISFHKDELVFDVTDTGRGISEVQSKSLFKPFTQADTSTTRHFGGTGLGLSLSRRLAQAFDGDFKLVSSELGAGSHFRVNVKVELPKGSTLVKVSSFNDHEFAGLYQDDINGDLYDGMKVLLVEDTLDNQILIRTYLERVGVEVVLASNGMEALEKIKSLIFDLVLMDIQMPGIDGYEATQRIRSLGIKTPIVALTAHAMTEEREKALKKGFSGFLTKPISKVNLYDLLGGLQVKSNQKHILVVEDDMDVRLLMKEVFEIDNFIVHTAKDGDEAFSLIQEIKDIDYVFLDLSIPGQSSAEVMELINAHPNRSSMKVILASGWDDLGEKAAALGADHFLRKPIDLDHLQELVK